MQAVFLKFRSLYTNFLFFVNKIFQYQKEIFTLWNKSDKLREMSGIIAYQDYQK